MVTVPCVSLALLMVTLFNYTVSVVTVVMLFVFYTRPDDCAVNKFFISFNMLLCVVASLVSVLPTVQVHTLHNTHTDGWETTYTNERR